MSTDRWTCGSTGWGRRRIGPADQRLRHERPQTPPWLVGAPGIRGGPSPDSRHAPVLEGATSAPLTCSKGPAGSPAGLRHQTLNHQHAAGLPRPPAETISDTVAALDPAFMSHGRPDYVPRVRPSDHEARTALWARCIVRTGAEATLPSWRRRARSRPAGKAVPARAAFPRSLRPAPTNRGILARKKGEP